MPIFRHIHKTDQRMGKGSSMTSIDTNAGNLDKMQLHEVDHIEANGISATCLRVPGGWIYTIFRLDSGQMNSVFVPYDNGFFLSNRSDTEIPFP